MRAIKIIRNYFITCFLSEQLNAEITETFACLYYTILYIEYSKVVVFLFSLAQMQHFNRIGAI